MRRNMMIAAAGALLLALSVTASAQQIHGDYVETRSADVYTGPCFANGETGLMGDQAIMAWRVSRGSWDGVVLDGLSVVGVAKASGTIGDQYNNPYPAKAVVIVDERATPEQRLALKSFAQSMGGELLRTIVAVETAPIEIDIEYHGEHPNKARVAAGALAGIRARLISDKDHFCGNEDIMYRPMAPTAHAMVGVALLDEFRGEGLGVRWTLRDKRSAYIGNFAR
ncbi:MAG: DUF1326 domain-containing protein [Acidobacteria bacterium]|nr:DUF1326 domain-containing protein [Acidobacteriota bacterium]MCW5968757.1 DUF1326 domain-containing protein [Blastocatellales bacterium]